MANRHKRKLFLPLALCLPLICVVVIRSRLDREGEKKGISTKAIEYEFAIFNTVASLKLWADEQQAAKVAKEVLASLQALHDRINVFDPESELSRLNREASTAPFVCSPELWDILQECRRGWRETEGAFDVSVGPLMRLWGFHRKRETLPTDAEIAETLALVGLDKMQFDDDRHSVRFPRSGMMLDFGGMAKGYALEQTLDILRNRGVRCALVDLGGNVGSLAEPPPGRKTFIIGVRNPFVSSELINRFPLLGQATATSGNYERKIVIQNRTIQHIIDPRSGQPVANFSGVTVRTPRGVNSDIYSTGVFVGGAKLAEMLVADGKTAIVLVSGNPEAPKMQTFGDLGLLD